MPRVIFLQAKLPAVQSTARASVLQNGVAQSSHKAPAASAAATTAPQIERQSPKSTNTSPSIAATAAKRKSAAVDSQLISPLVKRHRVSSESDDDGDDADAWTAHAPNYVRHMFTVTQLGPKVARHAISPGTLSH